MLFPKIRTVTLVSEKALPLCWEQVQEQSMEQIDNRIMILV